MEIRTTDLNELTQRLKRKCSIRLLEVPLEPTSRLTTAKLGLVEFEDTQQGGLHLVVSGPHELVNSQIARVRSTEGTILEPFVPRLVNESEVPVAGIALALYELREGSLFETNSLKSYLQTTHADYQLITSIVTDLTGLLYKWDESQVLEAREWVQDTAQGHYERVVYYLSNADSMSRLTAQFHDSTLALSIGNEAITADALYFDQFPAVLPNPLAYLDRSQQWTKNPPVLWPDGERPAHLTTGSVLVNPTSRGHTFFLFDVEDWAIGPLLTDWFSLELDILLNCLPLEDEYAWQQTVTVVRQLAQTIELDLVPEVLGQRTALALELVRTIRSKLAVLVRYLAERSGLQGNIELATWLAASAIGICNALDQSGRLTDIQRKVALLYSAVFLANIFYDRGRKTVEINVEKIGHVHIAKRTPSLISDSVLSAYAEWVVVEGGGSKRRFDAVESWYVDPDVRLVTVSAPPVHYDTWEVELELQSGLRLTPDERFRLDGLDDLETFISDNYRVVVLGEPGSGKTTLVERLFLDYARRITEPGARIPVLVRLGGFRGELSFHEFVLKQLGGLAPYYEEIKDRLLLLCDALNEMPQVSYDSSRRSLLDEVRDYLENISSNWILTCRVREYVSHKLGQIGRNVKRVEILPLDLPLIKQIIDRRLERKPELAKGLWAELCGSALYANRILTVWRKFKDNSEIYRFWDWQSSQTAVSVNALPHYATQGDLDVIRAMHERKLMRLCRNPYLLKLIYRVYERSINQGRAMPNSQGQLFHHMISDLIHDEKTRSLELGVIWSEDRDKLIIQALQVIAFVMQTNGQTRQTETEIFRTDVVTALKAKGFEYAEELIENAISAQILTGDEHRLSFSHQLMQEYFAGMTLVEKLGDTPSEELWPKDKWWVSTNLDETAVMLVGWHQDWEQIVKWIAEANPELAAECLVRNDRSNKELSNDTRRLIEGIIEKKIKEASSLQEKAATYRALGWFEDPRPGVGVINNEIPEIVWSVPITGGRFKMGGDTEAFNSWEGQELSIPYTYYMAKYLVTVAQYRCFIQDGGYTDPHWEHCWTREGLEWRRKAGKTQPFGWNNPRWTVPNHPVVGVTWYEAFAYANWLHQKLWQHGSLPQAGLVVRLPTEDEWEKAARGEDGRYFPWGPDFSPERGNVRTPVDWVGRTSAVGLFGELSSSPYGVLDMCGNVWEWCLPEWQMKYSQEQSCVVESEVARACRGGSWNHTIAQARSASRFWYRPGVADFAWGFRLCLSIKLY